jgi:Zn-dependent metalloprotease
MNRITLTAAALFVALVGNAGTPTSGPKGKTPLKIVNKIQGSPNLTGLGTPSQVQQSKTVNANGLVHSLATIYNPKTISEVKYAKDQTNPISFKSTKVISEASLKTAADVQAATISFLEMNKPLLNVNSPKDEFVMKSFETDNLGFTHVKMTQTYMGKTVWGKELIAHFSANGSSVNGRWTATPTVPALTSSISASSAISTVLSDAKPSTLNESANELLKYTGPTAELVLYPKGLHNAQDRWAYRVNVRTNFIHMYEYFVDAVTGQIINKADISCSAATQTSLTDLNGATQTIHTYQIGSTYYMIDASRAMFNPIQSQLPGNPVGAIWTLDANNSDASNIQVGQLTSSNNTTWSSSATAASASYNGAQAYSYYSTTHGRNSIDGNGGTIISVINVTDGGQQMDNAFWNGQLMAYGNGNTYFKPLAGGIDVAGHEMTHGVISATANMQYQDQSGALNESFADVFGVLINGASTGSNSYQIGATVTLPAFNSQQVLRDLADPHNGTTQGNNGWQPAVMSEYVTGTADNGGVHTNSGIPNHAFYYFATAVTRTKAEKVYYRALTKYLTTSSQFLDARLAVVQSAADLYGSGGAEVQAARNAFDSVEIYDGTPIVSNDTASVRGNDWIIYQSTDVTNANSLFMIPANTVLSPGDYHPLTPRNPLYRVSLTDDGSIAYFVDTNHNVYSVTTDYSNPVVTPISTTGSWDFVSVARDGSKLALISKYQDTAIYVFSFAQTSYKKYHLYAPTFSQGITTNGPVYAATVDWDPTSQWMIYDEYNVIPSTNSSNLNYWDIGLMKVWANNFDDFDSGQVTKLVNNLPDGVSIGNPVYAKNHRNIVAFDLVDTSGAFNTQGADINNGSVGLITSGNSVPNVPSFSGADDQVTFTYQDVSSNYLIGTTPLATDLINGNGNITQVAMNAQNSVWFRIGPRTFPAGVNEVAADNVKVYPVPASDRLIVAMTENASYTTVELTDMMGRVILTQAVTSKKEQLNVSSLASGVYLIRLRDESGSKTYTSRIVKN